MGKPRGRGCHQPEKHKDTEAVLLPRATNGGDSQVLESHSTRAPRLHDLKTDNKNQRQNSQVLESHSTRAPRLHDPKTDTKTNGGDSQVLESHSTRAPRLHDPKTGNKNQRRKESSPGVTQHQSTKAA